MKLGGAGFALALTLAAAQSSAHAAPPPRTPEQTQALADLAYILGRAHALHRLCVGEADNVWRGRMERMVAVEGADPELRRRLFERFNAGFVGGTAAYPACGAASAADERQTAAQGRALALKLASGSP